VHQVDQTHQAHQHFQVVHLFQPVLVRRELQGHPEYHNILSVHILVDLVMAFLLVLLVPEKYF
jgi:hypothetical protein